jgi:Holliday junction resolvasome RuvABC endonuclease subunit
MRSSELITVLGIDTGARGLGVSVFRGEELLFYAVKSIKRPEKEESLMKLKAVLRELMATYQVDFVALEKIVFVQQHRSFVKVVYDEVRDFFKERKIELFEYNPKLIHQTICGLEKPTKRNTALLLAQRFPELARYFNVPRRWQKSYYAQLFDAIAAGFVCATELKYTKVILSKSA